MKTDTIYPYYLSYLEERLKDGKISKEFNRHKTKLQWGDTWQYLTND